MPREPHTLAGKLVNVRRGDFFLTETADLRPAQIVRQDENDIGIGLGLWLRRQGSY
jgi:hypothetical protein